MSAYKWPITSTDKIRLRCYGEQQLLNWKGILTRFGASKLNPSSLSHSVMFGKG